MLLKSRSLSFSLSPRECLSLLDLVLQIKGFSMGVTIVQITEAVRLIQEDEIPAELRYTYSKDSALEQGNHQEVGSIGNVYFPPHVLFFLLSQFFFFFFLTSCPGIKPGSPTLQVDSLPCELPGQPNINFLFREGKKRVHIKQNTTSSRGLPTLIQVLFLHSLW